MNVGTPRARASRWPLLAALVAALNISLVGQQQRPPTQQPPGDAGFKFRSGVDLVNVTATVTDASGRFVPGLRKEDFVVYEDGQPQTISAFSNERVPVSLGIVLDTSSSMAGEKFAAARGALDRFLYELLDKDDQIFLYRFSGDPELMQDWTTDRGLLSRALSRIIPAGGTAMYDAVAESVPLAQQGKHRKKALVVISDGNDTSSRTDVMDVKQLVRESEVMIYAIGIDSQGKRGSDSAPPQQPPQPRIPPPRPLPFPIPGIGGGRRPGGGGGGWPQPSPPPTGGSPRVSTSGDHVNVAALRELTDDSGGRTEIIRSAQDLDPATANIADELSRQYYLAYTTSSTHDGRWHAIRVEVRNPSLRVRARRGFVAS